MYELQYLAHSFFRVKFPQCSMLIDPFITEEVPSKDFTRLIKSPVTEDQLKDISLILVTHEHFDHFDKKAIESIVKSNNSLVASSDHVLGQLNVPSSLKVPLHANVEKKLRSLTVKPIAVHHPNSFCPLGYTITDGNFTLFHAGDTDLMDSLKGIKADVALLPIGGSHTMDVVDAVRTAKMMKPRYAVPMHYNTFNMIRASASEFKEKIDKSIIPTEPLIMKVNQKVKF